MRSDVIVFSSSDVVPWMRVSVMNTWSPKWLELSSTTLLEVLNLTSPHDMP